MAAFQKRKGLPNKLSMTALADLERLGLNPIEMMKQVFDEAMTAYKSGRGYSDKNDAGTGYLAVAAKMATDLAKFKHPTISGIAIADLRGQDEAKEPMTTEQALKIIQSDPFAPESLKGLDTSRVVEMMTTSTLKDAALHLPKGKKE